jgi:proline iminopeptidase
MEGAFMPCGRRLPWICLLFLVLGVFPAKGHGQQTPSDAYQTGKVPRNGFDLYYRSFGAGEPVLILSGGPGDDCDYMMPVASGVARYARAILLEQRGTGRSIPPQVDKSTISLALYLEDYEALRKQLNVEQWTVIGHSAGGLLAMEYAAQYPEHVHKLVLLDTAPVTSHLLAAFDDNIQDRLSLEERHRLAALESSNSPDAQAEMAPIEADGLFFDRKLGAQKAAELGRAWHAPVGRLLGMEITGPGYDLRPRLKDLNQPVMVMSGRQDPMDPLMAYETSAAFKHSTLKFIDRAGHFPWFEQPQEFDHELRGFLMAQ